MFSPTEQSRVNFGGFMQTLIQRAKKGHVPLALIANKLIYLEASPYNFCCSSPHMLLINMIN
jgi:hypothetical protein